MVKLERIWIEKPPNPVNCYYLRFDWDNDWHHRFSLPGTDIRSIEDALSHAAARLGAERIANPAFKEEEVMITRSHPNDPEANCCVHGAGHKHTPAKPQKHIAAHRSVASTIIKEDKTMATKDLPRYRSHKEVQAVKIKRLYTDPHGYTMIEPEEDGVPDIKISNQYVMKHMPQVGGYYVVYGDGYKSWSPAEAFEMGYSRIK